MYTIQGGGSFTRTNIDQINANFSEVGGGSSAAGGSVDVYVNSQYGNNSDSGLTKGSPKSTIAGCASLFEPGIRVGISGVLFEEYSGPNVANVTLVGLGNQPLQGTTSGAPNGGGTTWLSPSGGSGILLKINGQGWTVQNIYFNNSAAQPCIQLMTSGGGDPPVDPDAAHAQIIGNVFTGADCGIQASGNPNFVTISDNTFFNFTGSGDCGIEAVTGAGVGTLQAWKVLGNYFYNNQNSIIIQTTQGFYFGNTFVSVGNTVTATTLLSLTGGTKNIIRGNNFGLNSDASGIATIVAMGTSPSAGPNYYNDVAEYAQPA